MTKRFFCRVWLLAVLSLLALPAVIQAQFTFTTNNGAITVTGYTGTNAVVVIPSVTNGYPVVSISGQAFENCTNLVSVTVIANVTNVGDYAFENCTSLISAYFGTNAPEGGMEAFYEDPATVVYYPNGTTGWGATFGGAPTVEETDLTQFWYYLNGNSITIDGYIGSDDAVVVPGIINGYPVTSIGAYGFEPAGVGPTSIIIPNTVTSMGYEAFAFCGNLSSLNMPIGLTSIGQFAFSGTSLAGLTIPSTVTNIGYEAFGGCTRLTNIFVNAANPAYSSVNGVLFDEPRHTLIQYPEGLTGSYTIPNGVTDIGGSAFSGCSLAGVTIPGSVTNIEGSAFQICEDLTSVTISNGVISIGDGAFEDCTRLASFVIPSSVKNIGTYAFDYCTNLTSITISGSIHVIGYETFCNCISLKSLYFLGNAPNADPTAFANCPVVTIYYMPGTSGWIAFNVYNPANPAVLWNPQATPFVPTGGPFGFKMTGPTNATIVVEACTNLVNPVWIPVVTNTLSGTGTSSFSDPQWTNYPNHYYRIRAK